MVIFNFFHWFFNLSPLIGLFSSLAIGYAIGKIRIGKFTLGGVAGSLIAGVCISLFNIPAYSAGVTGNTVANAAGKVITLPTGQMWSYAGMNLGDLKTFLFTIFIFAVGFNSGPAFFRSLGRKTIREVLLAVILAVTGLLSVWLVAIMFHLDKGLAAGVASGGLTQSAIMGVATDAMSKMNLSAATLTKYTSEVGVGYAVTYVFGSLGAIFVCANILPAFMGKGHSLRHDALEEESKQTAGLVLNDGESAALNFVSGRVYKVTNTNYATVADFEKANQGVTIEKLERSGKTVEITPEVALAENDMILLVGQSDAVIATGQTIGIENKHLPKMDMVMKTQEVVLTKGKFSELTVGELTGQLKDEIKHGVFVLSIHRRGTVIDLEDTEAKLQEGDVLRLYGSTTDVKSAIAELGTPIVPTIKSDLILFSLGCVIGLLIGVIVVKAGSIPITLGSGGGALLSGLFFGWLKGRRPALGGELPSPMLSFATDFGLAGFVAIVGLSSGMTAINTIAKQGINIFLAGLIVTFLPLLITMVIGKYLLGYKDNSAIFAGALAGSRSANPAFGQVLEGAGNTVPALPFAITYALANVFLTVLGPIIVAIVH